MEKIYQTLMGIMALAILLLASSDLYGKEINTMWVKCVSKTGTKDCKLVGDKILINSKEVQYKKLDVIEMYGQIYILVKDKK